MSERTRLASSGNLHGNSTLTLSCVLVFAVTVASGLVPSVFAGEGELTVMPNRGTVRNGLKLLLNSTWVEGPGYRPIHLEVKTADGLPSTKDRRLQLEIMPNTNWGYYNRNVVGEIVLPQGQVSVTGHLLMPQSNDWYDFHLNTSENGRELKDLSGYSLGRMQNNGGFDSTRPKILVIDSDAPTLNVRALARQTNSNLRFTGTYDLPDVRGLMNWNPSNGFSTVSSAVDDAALIDDIDEAFNLEVLPPEQLPDQWIAFSSLDLIFISLQDLTDIRTKRPRLATALKEWVGSGGNLVVFGVGDDYLSLNVLEAVLDLKSRNSVAEIDRWRPGAKKKDRETARLNALLTDEWNSIKSHLMNHPDLKIAKAEDELTALQPKWQQRRINDENWFPMRVLPLGHGKVIAMPEQNPFPGSQSKWSWLDTTIQPYKTWDARVGFNLERGDSQFQSYLIPGVGRPPVTTFRLLITLFVVIIGPVNYLFLKRRKRLFLLLVTVPLGAGIVTFSLFSYALIKDGLSTQARVHSFTQLDQRAGLASSWSRQTYFASLPPSRGLEFPGSATVHMLFHNDPQTRLTQERSARSMLWEDDTQRLARGYLGSRTTTEFMVANSAPIGEANLLFKRQGTDKPPRVINQLGVNVEQLLIVADDGSTFWAENIEPEQAITPEPRERTVAMETLQTIALENRPQEPEYYSENRSFFFGFNIQSQPSSTFGGAGILGYGRARSMFARASSDNELGPGEFIAIVPRNPFVPLGVDVADEKASYHVIRGRYLSQ